MGRIKNALENKLMDVRLRDKFLGEGVISQSDIDKHLSSLPDEEGNYEFVQGAEKKAPSAPAE